LEKGTIDFIINQKALRQGYEGIMAIYNKVILKQDINNETLLPIEIVTRENLDSYIKKYSESY